jgi:MoaA/NifB/PqqE/SkfB family radical SAM enzyme
VNRITNSNPSTCFVTWAMSNKCNYSCWYCPDELHNGSHGWPDLEYSINFFKWLAEKHEYVFIDLQGGEPTLWPKLLHFMESMPDNVEIELTTNASRTIRWWNSALPYIKRVTISYHASQATPSHILEVCELLKDKVNLSVLFLYDPEYAADIESLNADLALIDVNTNIKAIFPNFDGAMIPYTPEQLTFIKSNNHKSSTSSFTDHKPSTVFVDGIKAHVRNDIVLEKKNNFYGWKCMAGIKRIHITFDGGIYAGSCKTKLMGNFGDSFENIKFFEQGVICDKTLCSCIDDIRIEKWKI